MKIKACVLASSLALVLCACGPRAPADSEVSAVAAPPAPSPTVAGVPSQPVQAAPVTPSGPTTDGTSAATSASMEAGDKAVDDAIDSNLGDHQRYKDVINALQSGVAAGDAAKVAALVQYPISIDIAGKATVLKSEADFVARYKDFMTPEISNAITATAYSDLFVNYKGVSFGSGQAWINGICKDADCKTFDVKVVTLQSGPK